MIAAIYEILSFRLALFQFILDIFIFKMALY